MPSSNPNTPAEAPSRVLRRLLPEGFEPVPHTNQLWELEMACWELEALGTRQKLVERSAFLARVDGEETYHYRICRASPLQVDKVSSLRRQTFFDVNQFKTGYATHGLFPYRGKFHPQLVRAILNVIGVERGDTVLDPMAGSGTLCIEACINGIHSVGVDVSPFCSLMTRAKTGALGADVERFRGALMEGLAGVDSIEEGIYQGEPFGMEPERLERRAALDRVAEYREVVLMCYLDAMGYAARRANKTTRQLVPVIAERYAAAVEQFGRVRDELGLELGRVEARIGDARVLDLPAGSVDGIVTSPPYSFAIDYAENDRPQLAYLGHSTDDLKQRMIGLAGGKTVPARVRQYFQDMAVVFAEMARVLKPGRYCVVVIGSNEIQTGGIRHEVEFARLGAEVGLALRWNMVRPIEGIRNSMRDEYVLFFQKT